MAPMNTRTVYLVGDEIGRFIGDKGLLDLDNARIYNSAEAAERGLWKAQKEHQKILDNKRKHWRMDIFGSMVQSMDPPSSEMDGSL